jgi:hypothetical protein
MPSCLFAIYICLLPLANLYPDDCLLLLSSVGPVLSKQDMHIPSCIRLRRHVFGSVSFTFDLLPLASGLSWQTILTSPPTSTRHAVLTVTTQLNGVPLGASGFKMAESSGM